LVRVLRERQAELLLARVRDRRVVDEHIEPAELAADAVRRGGDRRAVGHVELERARVALDRRGRLLSAREVA